MADIPINPVTRRVQFTGNTGTGPFAFTFNILADEDIAVYKNTTQLSLTTDYTIATNANGTGSVTLVAALITSDVLTIIGGRELERTTDFVTAGDLLASSLNEQLDSLVIMAQQLDEKMTRSFKVNPGDVFTDLEMPGKDARKGTVLGFNATSGDPEAGPEIADVQSLSAITSDIATLADIEDGTDATDAIQTVAGISANVTTVAGISSNVTTVAGISSDVTAVAGDEADIGTVATNIANVNTVAGISANVTTVAGNTTNINTVAGNNANVTTVGGISADVTTVAGISSDVTTVAADGTDIGTVATNIASVNTTATNISSINTNTANITAIQNAATNAATATTKASEASTSATNAATSATNASTSATNASNSASAAAASAAAAAASADTFDDTYLGSKASDPSVDNDGDALTAGDLYFNTTDNKLKVYSGSAWQTAALDSSGFVETTGDTMTGDLDVQGTVTADGLTVDNDSAIIKLSNPDTSVSASQTLGTIQFEGNDSSTNANGFRAEIEAEYRGVGGATAMRFKTASENTSLAERMLINHNGDISFYEDTGTTAKFFWDASAESLGIGTSSPDLKLDVSHNVSSEYVATFQNTADNLELKIGTTSGLLNIQGANASSNAAYNIALNAEGGNVGIGTSSPSDILQVNHPSTSKASSIRANATNTDAYFAVGNSDLSDFILLFGGHSGNNASTVGWDDSNDLRFATYQNHTGTFGAERMRIDSSGYLLVGKTAQGLTNAGFEVAQSGQASATQSGASALRLNRLSSDGEILQFRKDGSQVGSIGNSGSNLILSNGYGSQIKLGNNEVVPTSSGKDLGNPTDSWRDLYLYGGVYLGGTGSANKLDDYEEGTWTPSYVSTDATNPTVSYNLRDGRYTKIGRTVIASFRIRGAITGTKTGSLRISGLPFTSSSNSAGSGGSIRLTENFGTNSYPASVACGITSTEVILTGYDSSDPRAGLFTQIGVSTTSTSSAGNYILGQVVYDI